VIAAGALLLLLAQTGRLINSHALYIPGRIVGFNRLALWLYVFLMLPGVLLHELSHAMAALLLLLEVRDFHIGPIVESEGLVFGYVMTEKQARIRGCLV
jgi:hypothetical protein